MSPRDPSPIPAPSPSRGHRGSGFPALCLALALTVGSTAWANPEGAAPSGHSANGSNLDPLTALLVERGLLPAAAQESVRRFSDGASELVLSAMNFLGVRYRRGGNSTEDGFDCSGFTRHVFEHSIGLLLPRRADEQARLPGLAKVGRDELRPGDLVFFNTMRRTFSHVGIYIGDNKFIHAPKPGAAVRIEDMRVAYWSSRFNGARRAPGDAAPGLADWRKTLSGYLGTDERNAP